MPGKPYAQEENNWIKNNFYNFDSYQKLYEKYCSIFGNNHNYRNFKYHCLYVLKLTFRHSYSQQEKKWLIKHYPLCSETNFYLKFNKHFNLNVTRASLKAEINRLNIKSQILYSEEEKNWIRNNYQREKSTNDIYKDFCKTFGNIRSYQSFLQMGSKLGLGMKEQRTGWGNNENHFNKKKREMNVPTDYVLSDLGNGKYLPMKKNVYRILRNKGNLKQGEVTETFYDLELVNEQIRKIKNEN